MRLPTIRFDSAHYPEMHFIRHNKELVAAFPQSAVVPAVGVIALPVAGAVPRRGRSGSPIRGTEPPPGTG